MEPRVAVVYGLGAVGPLAIVQACEGLCSPVFVIDSADSHTAALVPLLNELGPTLDVAAEGVRNVARAVARRGFVEGVTTFHDGGVRIAATIARRLGLPYNSVQTARALTDKLAQRRALNAAGVTPVACAAIDDARHVRAAVESVGTPAVLKPREGAGSRDTFPIANEADVFDALNRLTQVHERGFTLEALIPAGVHPAGDWLGDYLSVETLAYRGSYHHFTISDKLPLVWPYRETGMFVPSALPEDVQRDVEALATRALTALNVREGAVHTEIKLAPDGPVVIEVNGRLAGVINDLMIRVTGFDPLRAAMEIALGRRPQLPPLSYRGVALHLSVPPSPDAVEVIQMRDPRELRDIAGVWEVINYATAGKPVDWRRGTLEHARVIRAEVATHRELRALVETLREAGGRSVSLRYGRSPLADSAMNPHSAHDSDPS